LHIPHIGVLPWRRSDNTDHRLLRLWRLTAHGLDVTQWSAQHSGSSDPLCIGAPVLLLCQDGKILAQFAAQHQVIRSRPSCRVSITKHQVRVGTSQFPPGDPLEGFAWPLAWWSELSREIGRSKYALVKEGLGSNIQRITREFSSRLMRLRHSDTGARSSSACVRSRLHSPDHPEPRLALCTQLAQTRVMAAAGSSDWVNTSKGWGKGAGAGQAGAENPATWGAGQAGADRNPEEGADALAEGEEEVDVTLQPHQEVEAAKRSLTFKESSSSSSRPSSTSQSPRTTRRS